MPTIESPVDQVRLRYDVDGDGPPLVLLHGSLLSRALWRGLGYLDLLSQRFTVIRPDIRGHGSSGAPHEPSAYRLPVLVADLLAILDDAGANAAHLLGYSLGARIAVATAVQHPERVHRVVSLGGSPAENSAVSDQVFFPGAVAVLRDGDMEEFCERLGWGPDAQDPLARASRQAFLQADPAAMAALLTAIEHTPALGTDQLAACQVPTLWMAGGKDEPRLSESRQAAELMPHGSFIELPGRTHASTLSPAGSVLRTAMPFLMSGNVH